MIRAAKDICAADRWMRRSLPLAVLAAALASASPAEAQQGQPTTGQANTGRAARTEAQQSVPLDRVDARFEQSVAEVLARPSIYRRLPVQSVESDPEMFTFLACNPDVVINIWQLMGVSAMQIHRVGDTTFVADDQVGTKTRLDYVLTEPGLQVIYADGAYDGQLTRRPIHGRCVLVLKSRVSRGAAGQSLVTTQMDTFFKVDHLGAAAVAKTLQPLIGRSADYNFLETVNFMGKLSRTASANPDGVERLGERLTEIRPTVREQFAEVAQGVGRRSAATSAAPTRTATSQSTSPRIPAAESPQRTAARD